MDIQFKTRNDKQLQAAEYWIDDSTEEILYGGAKGGGKSFLGVSLIFGNALIYPGTHYFIARKELIDLRRFTIPSIHEVFAKWGLDINHYAKYNGQDHCYNLINGSKVFLIACADEPSDPLFERFGSMQMTRGWIEEGGEVPEDAKDNLWLSIGRWKNGDYGLSPKLLITANPKKGWMKREFVDLYNKDLLPPKKAYIQAFAEDNTYLPQGYTDKLHADKNNVRRQRLAEGNWEYDDDQDSLITYDVLSDLFSNTVLSGENYMTVDVARKGRDTTVMAFWRGLKLYRIEQFAQQITTETETKIKDFAQLEKVPFSHILVDEDGVGGGVVDHLVGVKGFTANSTPVATAAVVREKQKKVNHSLVPKTVYGNIKAQCGWKMAELINEHEVAVDGLGNYREEIIEELTAILRDRTPDGENKKLLIDKADVKKEIRRSPDIGDAILMRAWFELVKNSGLATSTSLPAAVVEEQAVNLSRNRRTRGNNSSK